MNNRYMNKDFFQNTILLLGILAGLGLFGYALVNLIRMPAVSPDAFVPKSLVQPEGFPFGLFQLISALLFAFAFLPVSVIFTVKRYSDNPHAMILGCSLMCLALFIEIINNLPILGTYLYPVPLESISPDVILYLSQTSSIRYLSFDVAGFTLIYASLLIYSILYWKSRRVMSYLIVTSVITFAASVPFLWLGGIIAVALMAISIFCLTPIPVLFGKWASE
jgi:hypothetical protein